MRSPQLNAVQSVRVSEQRGESEESREDIGQTPWYYLEFYIIRKDKPLLHPTGDKSYSIHLFWFIRFRIIHDFINYLMFKANILKFITDLMDSSR